MDKKNAHNYQGRHQVRHKGMLRKFWEFLKQDTWQSWVVSLALAFIAIKFVFFPLLSFALATPLPLVVVESCSMHHDENFDSWWEENGEWYEERGISKKQFEEFPFKNGMSKGHIIIVSGRGGYNTGDVVIFNSVYRFPLIHRAVNIDPLSTKGDNNPDQLAEEKIIAEEAVIGKSIAGIPYLGWVKLIFFEGSKPANQRGFC